MPQKSLGSPKTVISLSLSISGWLITAVRNPCFKRYLPITAVPENGLSIYASPVTNITSI